MLFKQLYYLPLLFAIQYLSELFKQSISPKKKVIYLNVTKKKQNLNILSDNYPSGWKPDTEEIIKILKYQISIENFASKEI